MSSQITEVVLHVEKIYYSTIPQQLDEKISTVIFPWDTMSKPAASKRKFKVQCMLWNLLKPQMNKYSIKETI